MEEQIRARIAALEAEYHALTTRLMQSNEYRRIQALEGAIAELRALLPPPEPPAPAP